MTARRVCIGGLVVAALLTAGRAGRGAPPHAPEVATIDGISTSGPLAVTRTGQTLSVLEPSRRRVVGVDPAEPLKRWTALESAGAGGETIEALASLDSSTLLAVWRDGEEWSLRVHRVHPPGDDGGGSATLQTLPLGRAAGLARVDVVVSPSRNIAAVAGLPPPLPPLVRGRITGARIDAFTDRRCPPLAERRLVGTAFGPGDEWILLTVPAADPAAPVRLEWFNPTGSARLIDLDTGLPGICDVAWDNEAGLLYALTAAASPNRPEGLWRLDAALLNGRQTCRPICIMRLESPHSVVCLPRQTVIVSQGGGMGRITRVQVPDDPVDAAAPAGSPRD